MKNIQNQSSLAMWLEQLKKDSRRQAECIIYSSLCQVAPSEITGAIWPWFFSYEKWFNDHVSEHKGLRQLAIEYIIKGNMKIFSGTQSCIAPPGSAVVTFRGLHRKVPGPAGYCEKLCIIVGGTALDVVQSSFSLPELSIIEPFPESLLLSMRNLIDMMLSKNVNEIEISSLCYRFLLETAETRSRKLPEPLQLALHYMRANLGKPESLSYFAYNARCSRQELQKLFKRHLGETPFEHLKKMRLNAVKELLLTTDLPVKEIAWQCGYRSQLYLSTDFKRAFKLSPREFRKQQRASGN